MNLLTKYIIFGIASFIQGFAMATFLFPHFIPSGGAASIGVLLNYIFHIPFAISLWVLNASLLIVSIRWLGKSSALGTMYCVTVTSATINFISPFMIHPVSNVILDLAIGSLFFGIGLGTLFRMGASSGGMDILALIISTIKGFSPGKTLFWINGSILLLTGIVVDWKIILYAVICQFIGTRIIDFICEFPLHTKYVGVGKGQKAS